MKSLKFLLLLLFTGALSASLAQQPKEEVDAKAKAILDQLAQKTKTFMTIQADFVLENEKQLTNKETKVTDSQEGKIKIKGNKYVLEIKGQTIICDSKTQWTYIKESNEVQVNNAPDPNATDNINPVNIFTIYEKGYKYKYENEITVNGAKADVVSLFPLDPDKRSYHTIRLTIDKVKKQILHVKIMNKNGTFTNIAVKNFISNKEIADATFTFNKADYKGVEVVDLRD